MGRAWGFLWTFCYWFFVLASHGSTLWQGGPVPYSWSTIQSQIANDRMYWWWCVEKRRLTPRQLPPVAEIKITSIVRHQYLICLTRGNTKYNNSFRKLSISAAKENKKNLVPCFSGGYYHVCSKFVCFFIHLIIVIHNIVIIKYGIKVMRDFELPNFVFWARKETAYSLFLLSLPTSTSYLPNRRRHAKVRC